MNRISIHVFCWIMAIASISSGDELTLMVGGRAVELSGEILVEAQDDSLYFLQNNGKIWFVKPEQIKRRIDSDDSAKPDSKKQIGQQLLKELPAGFRIYETRHYVIAYQTELVYAKWVASLYESRLFRAFETFWEKKKKTKLTDPTFPLVAIVFGSKQQYQAFVDRELGPGQEMVAYYNIQTNRVAMFDLTAGQRSPNRKLNERRIEEILGSRGAVEMVATMIHEATHQLIFNRGLQTRFADTPLWLNEGLAMYFEAPNLQSKRGWQRPGLIFEERLIRFRQYFGRRPKNSLEALVASNQRLQEADQALDAYAESWALVHFLINRRSKEFVAYMKHMSQKKALVEDSPDKRLTEFKEFFGEDLTELDTDFVKYIRNLR